jgi:transposase
MDLNGPLLESLTVVNTTAGLAQLQLFGSQFSLRRWAIEGAGNHFIAEFAKELLACREAVFPKCPNLTSQYRWRSGRKKNDVVDATNVARTLLANPWLPLLRNLDSLRELQELSRAQRRLSEQLKSNCGAL